ncbi:leucine-rich repeat and fibronectin type-III domain-containing protein 4 [Ixodes scapularis]|uniref:Secreted protein, putative n=1 Tax=Ixodes scapularis TaxID=6945 RepID=B7PY91_IXOSC|nr:leucine-rich repeat and fibronectin type-III domain-containing protein 4 [Ixodes scapularis]EEC11563.1 secreted protein, putative [Ixodes scapularis]|eukprot:XP_002402718.1 secreted protein, putative [Ixodes scapularis]
MGFGRSLFSWFLLGVLASWVSAEPSCIQEDGYKYRRYICRGFESPEDFKSHVKLEHSSKETWFLLLDSHLKHISPESFAGLNVSVLIWSNVTVDGFDQSSPEASPFAGLENSVKKMVFRRQSSVPLDWSMLKDMNKLEELHLQGFLDLNLTKDFGQLPPSLKVLFIFDASINHVDPDWLASLTNLEALIVRVTNLNTLKRSMLPRPAPKLATLDLAENHLTAFPEGLGDDLPALRFVNVEDNRITTLEEKDIAPLHKDSVLVRMIGNPMHCDCKLWFLLDYTDRWHYFLCRSPEPHFNSYIKMLTEADLPCVDNPPATTQAPGAPSPASP